MIQIPEWLAAADRGTGFRDPLPVRQRGAAWSAAWRGLGALTPGCASDECESCADRAAACEAIVDAIAAEASEPAL